MVQAHFLVLDRAMRLSYCVRSLPMCRGALGVFWSVRGCPSPESRPDDDSVGASRERGGMREPGPARRPKGTALR